MNTLVKTITRVSPNEMIFATSANHETHFLKSPEMTSSNEMHHEHIKQLVKAQGRIIEIAQRNQEEHDISETIPALASLRWTAIGAISPLSLRMNTKHALSVGFLRNKCIARVTNPSRCFKVSAWSSLLEDRDILT